VLWRGPRLRVVLVEHPTCPGFCRVIAGAHAREMTDLPEPQQMELLRAVLGVERAVRAVLRPDKVNLASLGNVTPHVHWHVIPRWRDDGHFPEPVWTPARRAAPRALTPAQRDALAAAVASEMRAQRLASGSGGG
jgi:diadenosine tetraphosphate (Ap4A) HIT family hydrolase